MQRPKYAAEFKSEAVKQVKPAQVAPNQLERQFQHDEPDHAWAKAATRTNLA